ncbi:response regulator transcription factor [Paenibacillus glycanilyticus]|uniref:response regulator transcription factor n=1 Tax=Paenibacillus glycanilyticus TaxID=126569 RepID=UPI000FD7A4C7|nr:response regulator [Paenibacillus glycanilyticus]
MFRTIIVEDEPRILRYLKDKIMKLNPEFKVVGTYNNGEDALIELHWTQPHVLIADIRMPVMNGLELISQVKNKLPDIQCAIISGYDDYAYLREAIKLEITDYLLKPATDLEIIQLLENLKSKLLLNQSLLEREVGKQLIEASVNDQLQIQWDDIAQELFYHANYMLVYTWSPFGEVTADFKTCCEALLYDGERCFPLTSGNSNTAIWMFGVYSCSPERLAEWKAVLSSRLRSDSNDTVSVSLSTKGLKPVPTLLAGAKKQTVLQSRFRPFCFLGGEEGYEDLRPYLDAMTPALHRLAQHIIKQQKQYFVKELGRLLFPPPAHAPITRKGWENLLLYLSHTLHTVTKESLRTTFDSKQSMESELTEEVWKTRSTTELGTQVMEILSSYFFKSELEQRAQKDWAEDAKKYILAHFTENISLSTIADTFQLNSSYLNRLFKQAYQISIPDFLVQIRMEEACRFIKENPYVLIKEIAEHVGYLDAFYFSKVFKQHTGHSPSDYKNLS